MTSGAPAVSNNLVDGPTLYQEAMTELEQATKESEGMVAHYHVQRALVYAVLAVGEQLNHLVNER